MIRYIIALIIMALASPALAQNACFEREAVVKHLHDKFNETPTYAGIAINGNVLEVFTSPNGETWTVYITRPDGITCIKSSGKSWIRVPTPPMGKGS